MARLECNILPFVENEDGPTSVRWEAWKDQFFAYLALKGVEDHDEMFKALQCFGGHDVRKIIKTCGDNEMDDIFQEALDALDNYYSPKMSLRYERYRFRQMIFNPHEKLDQFVVRLRYQANLCGFEDQSDEMIMDQIVFATQNDDKLRAKYLDCDRTLEAMLKVGRTYESVRAQVHEFRSQPEIATRDVCEVSTKNVKCNRCNGNHLGSYPRCPARSVICHFCNKTGHFARCCMSKKQNFRNNSSKKSYGNDVSKLQTRKDDTKHEPKFIREVADVTKKVEIRELF